MLAADALRLRERFYEAPPLICYLAPGVRARRSAGPGPAYPVAWPTPSR